MEHGEGGEVPFNLRERLSSLEMEEGVIIGEDNYVGKVAAFIAHNTSAVNPHNRPLQKTLNGYPNR